MGTGGWVGPRAGLDKEARGKIICPCRGLNPDRQVVQPVVRDYILPELNRLITFHYNPKAIWIYAQRNNSGAFAHFEFQYVNVAL
jgi:hypothetical protein